MGQRGFWISILLGVGTEHVQILTACVKCVLTKDLQLFVIQFYLLPVHYVFQLTEEKYAFALRPSHLWIQRIEEDHNKTAGIHTPLWVWFTQDLSSPASWSRYCQGCVWTPPQRGGTRWAVQTYVGKSRTSLPLSGQTLAPGISDTS